MFREAILRELRRRNRTRYWLAKRSGVSTQTLYPYLKGKQDVTSRTVGKLMSTLNLTVDFTPMPSPADGELEI